FSYSFNTSFLTVLERCFSSFSSCIKNSFFVIIIVSLLFNVYLPVNGRPLSYKLSIPHVYSLNVLPLRCQSIVFSRRPAGRFFEMAVDMPFFDKTPEQRI